MRYTLAQHIALTSLVVADYDEAIDFFVTKLNFQLLADQPIPEEQKRWVVVSPSQTAGAQLVLAQAKTDTERLSIGNQTGGRVFLFLHTDDFWKDYKAYKSKGVEFIEKPREESYGTVAVFKDLYGNLWDLLELSD